MTEMTDTETEAVKFVAKFYGIDENVAIERYKDEIEAYKRLFRNRELLSTSAMEELAQQAQDLRMGYE